MTPGAPILENRCAGSEAHAADLALAIRIAACVLELKRLTACTARIHAALPTRLSERETRMLTEPLAHRDRHRSSRLSLLDWHDTSTRHRLRT